MTKPRNQRTDDDLCQFPFADGRHCRMLRHSQHPRLCAFHANEELQLLESRRLGAEIAAPLTGHFITSTDIVHMLGKVFTALAQNRIPQRNAATLGYLGQLMLQGMPAVSDEIKHVYSFESWRTLLDRGIYPTDAWRARTPLPTNAQSAATQSADDAEMPSPEDDAPTSKPPHADTQQQQAADDEHQAHAAKVSPS